MFKVNNEDTGAMCEIYSKLTNDDVNKFVTLFGWLHGLSTDFTHCPRVSIVEFEQVNAGRVEALQ